MKPLRNISTILIILLVSCNTNQNSKLEKQFEAYYTRKQLHVLNDLVDIFSKQINDYYIEEESAANQLSRFMNDLESQTIANSLFRIDKKTKSDLKKDLVQSGLLDEIWTTSNTQMLKSKDETVDPDKGESSHLASNKKTETSYSPNLYGKYMRSLKSVASKDDLVHNYIQAKTISENLSLNQLAKGLNHSMTNAPYDEYFLLRILVAEYFIPLVLSN